MKIPLRLLEHRVTITPLESVGSSVGPRFGTARTDIPAIVVEKRTKVRDMRASSETSGEDIETNAHILVRAEQRVEPGSKVTIWPGESIERTVEVVSLAYGVHSIAPESAQFWGV